MSQQPAGEKTEKATPERMRKAHRDGSLGRSQDLTAWVVVGSAAVMLPIVLERGANAAAGQVLSLGEIIHAPEPAKAVEALGEGLWSAVLTVAPMLVAAALAAIVAGAAQGGVHISTKKLKPRTEQFNLVKGLKRTFGGQAWWQGAKAFLKTAVVGLVLYSVVVDLLPLVLQSGALSVSQILGEVGSRIRTLLTWGVAAGLVLAAVDVFVVLKRNRKTTRMSKQELKDDHKRTEGDPLIKGQIRAKQRAMSRNRMLAAVADADVVVVNPTHVAVALRYEPGKGAPRVVAKGQGHIAARIRERASEHRVAVVQDITLARTLNAMCEVGHEVPEYLYEAVARVLAFVMSLRRRGSASGTHRMPSPPKDSR
ncbi:EscU/YscU/HrcU family type III secretion system export apparatus switch protein [Georgenia sp. H159]|uniref:EscU/YscU/HrcU family type III secretion system export apparatus switch protein n=1 Tax=Georgenia sp. H159 TaxID=3076115 RepID=UPI002D79F089|nr:EscU/YscU/HrcU family type III secretion system export apparatus switch protein [Georgenia sp. H159]